MSGKMASSFKSSFLEFNCGFRAGISRQGRGCRLCSLLFLKFLKINDPIKTL